VHANSVLPLLLAVGSSQHSGQVASPNAPAASCLLRSAPCSDCSSKKLSMIQCSHKTAHMQFASFHVLQTPQGSAKFLTLCSFCSCGRQSCLHAGSLGFSTLCFQSATTHGFLTGDGERVLCLLVAATACCFKGVLGASGIPLTCKPSPIVLPINYVTRGRS
jgi:hypothetical protein